MKRLRKIINTVIWSLVGLYLLSVILLHIPIVQSFIGSTVAQAVSKKLGTEVVVTRVDLGFFNRIIIDNFYIKDHKQQNLLKASRLSVKINPISIFKGKIIISSIQLLVLNLTSIKKAVLQKLTFNSF